MSVPSVILADATWYGSLRGGVTFGGGDDTRFMDGGSRWGVKGSNELAEGLSATYRFETKLSTANAESSGGGDEGGPGGRLAYVGLSGGFGTLSLGQVWSASFNSTGAITDNTLLWGSSATSYRVGNALSYSNSVGDASLQIDAIMDSTRDTGNAVDQVEFGMTIGLGDIGKLAVAYVESKDTNIDDAWVHVPAVDGKPEIDHVPAEYYLIGDQDDGSADTALTKIEVLVPLGDTDGDATNNANGVQNDYFDSDGDFKETGEQSLVNNIQVLAGKHVIDTDTTESGVQPCMNDPDKDPVCKSVTIYVHRINPTDDDTTNSNGSATNVETITPAEGNNTNTVTYYILSSKDGAGLIQEGDDENDFRMTPETKRQKATPYVPATVEDEGVADIKPGYKATHVAVEFGLGGVTTWLGYSKSENNGGDVVKPKKGEEPPTGDIMADYTRNPASETKTTHAGVRGSVGDNGLNYLVAYRDVDTAGKKTNPYVINLNKSLGDGATAFVEHANDDDGKSGRTWVGLKVDF